MTFGELLAWWLVALVPIGLLVRYAFKPGKPYEDWADYHRAQEIKAEFDLSIGFAIEEVDPVTVKAVINPAEYDPSDLTKPAGYFVVRGEPQSLAESSIPSSDDQSWPPPRWPSP